MREVFSASSGGGLVESVEATRVVKETSSVTGKGVVMVPKGCARGAFAPDIKMSSTPGYLELSSERTAALICQTPIEEVYEVETKPFARGKYAMVRKCRHRVTGLEYAAKFLKKQFSSKDVRSQILHEVAILDACAGSSRIIRLHQVFESRHEMVLLLELAPDGELQMLLDKDEVPTEAEVKVLMRQILDGVVFLHSNNVAHLDLKPQNLVLTGQFPECEVKLCDLGISRYISKGDKITHMLGTLDYVAPEVLNYDPIGLATDMWSVGVLLYVLLTGCSPFGGDTKEETRLNISLCKLDFPEELFEDISEDAIDLMTKLMVKNPSQRLDAQQCLQHQWFRNAEPQASPPCPLKLNIASRVQDSHTSPLPPRKLDGRQAVASPKLKHKAPVELTITDKSSDLLAELTQRASPKLKLKVPLKTPLSDKPSDLIVNVTPKASPKLKHKAPVETPDTEKSNDFQCAEISLPKQPDAPAVEVKSAIQEVKPSSLGIKSSRTETLKRNLTELAKKVAESNENSGIEEVKASKPPTVLTPLITQKDILNTAESSIESGKMRKAKSMHMLPTHDKFEQPNTNIAVHSNVSFYVSEVRRRAPSSRDGSYRFRKCCVIDFEDVSPPMSIAGSVSSSVYSDQSISDSGSEVSELSIDSSSDRSSIISLDDSLDYNTKPGRYITSNHTVWRKQSSLAVNDSLASNYARFGSVTSKHLRQSMMRGLAHRANTEVLNRAPTPATTNRRMCRLECRKENCDNIVIMEMKAGKYPRVSELKCDSLSTRIRKLKEFSEK